MKKPTGLQAHAAKSLIVILALLLVVFSGSVLARSDEGTSAQDKRADKSRETAKLRLEGAKLKVCENRERAINNILDRIARRGEKRLEVYDKIFERVQDFYTRKGLSLSNYDELIAQANAKKSAAQATLETIKTKEVNFACDGTDPKGAAASFKTDLRAEIKAIHEYKQSIRDLITAIKTAVSNTADDNSSGSEGER